MDNCFANFHFYIYSFHHLLKSFKCFKFITITSYPVENFVSGFISSFCVCMSWFVCQNCKVHILRKVNHLIVYSLWFSRYVNHIWHIIELYSFRNAIKIFKCINKTPKYSRLLLWKCKFKITVSWKFKNKMKYIYNKAFTIFWYRMNWFHLVTFCHISRFSFKSCITTRRTVIRFKFIFYNKF